MDKDYQLYEIAKRNYIEEIEITGKVSDDTHNKLCDAHTLAIQQLFSLRSLVECKNCKYCCNVKREMTGYDLCLCPETTRICIPPGSSLDCKYYEGPSVWTKLFDTLRSEGII